MYMHLLSPFSVAHVYMCPRLLATWDLTIYVGVLPGEKSILPKSSH